MELVPPSKPTTWLDSKTQIRNIEIWSYRILVLTIPMRKFPKKYLKPENEKRSAMDLTVWMSLVVKMEWIGMDQLPPICDSAFSARIALPVVELTSTPALIELPSSSNNVQEPSCDQVTIGLSTKGFNG
ncbi:hypothetical protein PanWU01x14_321770 [Parasponia andersonii]|uniref:Uncharacterized protein n=1 Tax=Parasponia andersonii TaxID=3476 RepID=A0A2P5AL67_PARAD|nr:hypothetical protein PanWU01x14_321770 [Parasponia andersonii]